MMKHENKKVEIVKALKNTQADYIAVNETVPIKRNTLKGEQWERYFMQRQTITD